MCVDSGGSDDGDESAARVCVRAEIQPRQHDDKTFVLMRSGSLVGSTKRLPHTQNTVWVNRTF